MQGLRIRLAVPSERGELEELQRRASLALDQYREQLEAHPETIDLPMEQIRRGEVLVAETGSYIVGFAAVVEKGGAAELDGLFVEPAHWRKGIGSALVDAATHEARKRGLSLITVVAEPAARGFYERCGFAAEDIAETRFGPAIRMSR